MLVLVLVAVVSEVWLVGLSLASFLSADVVVSENPPVLLLDADGSEKPKFDKKCSKLEEKEKKRRKWKNIKPVGFGSADLSVVVVWVPVLSANFEESVVNPKEAFLSLDWVEFASPDLPPNENPPALFVAVVVVVVVVFVFDEESDGFAPKPNWNCQKRIRLAKLSINKVKSLPNPVLSDDTESCLAPNPIPLALPAFVNAGVAILEVDSVGLAPNERLAGIDNEGLASLDFAPKPPKVPAPPLAPPDNPLKADFKSFADESVGLAANPNPVLVAPPNPDCCCCCCCWGWSFGWLPKSNEI